MAIPVLSDLNLSGDLHLVSATPVIYFDDTSQTNDGAFISGSSSAASLALSADYGDNVNTTKIYFSRDGSEVGHFRGDSSQIGSLRLFPQKNNNTAQGIFFGTETSEPAVGDWTGTRVMSMDSNSVLHLYPSTGTTGAIQIASGGPGTGNVTTGGDVYVGDDLFLQTDQAVLNMGAHNDFTITHDGMSGATIAGTPINFTGAINIGVDDTGYDVKFFGATSGKYMLWDESDDALEFTDDTKIKLGTGGDGEIYSSSDDIIIANVTSDKDIIFKGNDGGSTITALTLDMSNEGTAKFAKGISTGDTSGGNSGPLTLAGGMTQTFQGSGGTTSFNSHTNSTTASGSTDASAFLISQKNTSGTAIEYRQGVIADGNAFFGTWSSGSITGMGLNVSTGDVTFSNDVDVTGSVKVTQNLRRTITAVSHSTNTFTCTLTANDNFSFTLNNAANTINIVAASENVGQSGTIVATNPSSVGSFSVNAIQGNGDADEVLTPSSATINWPSTANDVNLISYYVAAADKILINFIGSFGNPS